jgi:hypothetical protein
MSSIASSSRTRVAFIAQTAVGAFPATPAFSTLRRTGGNLVTKKTIIESEEVQLDGRTRAIYQTGQDVAGSYDFELSYGTFDDLIAGVLQSSWTTNSISDGTTQQQFGFEETVDLGGSGFAYSRFVDCEISSLALTLASRAAVKGTVSVMGKSEAIDTAIVTGATYVAPNTNQVETSATVGTLSVLGLGTQPIIKNLTMTIDRALRIRDSIGTLYTTGFGSGPCKVSGSFDVYFSDVAIAQMVLAHGSGALQIPIGTVTGKKYLITIPAAQLLDGARKIGGRTEDVMYSVPFQAIGNAASPLITVQRAIA